MYWVMESMKMMITRMMKRMKAMEMRERRHHWSASAVFGCCSYPSFQFAAVVHSKFPRTNNYLWPLRAGP